MSTVLKNLLQLANSLFSKGNQFNLRDLQTNETYASFLKLYSQLRLQDLNLDPEDFVSNPRRPYDLAPISFAKIFQNENFSLTLFGFRGEHSHIPLHDHPGMFAFARCLHGSLAVQSYNVPNEKTVAPREILEKVPNYEHKLVPAMFAGQDIMTSDDSQVVTLSPWEKNLHQIHSTGDRISVLADIISPPYTGDTDSYFYQIIDTVHDPRSNQPITWLFKTKDTLGYYCDTVPYPSFSPFSR